jgi:Zn-dependent peptidase ImmA (M78 family)
MARAGVPAVNEERIPREVTYRLVARFVETVAKTAYKTPLEVELVDAPVVSHLASCMWDGRRYKVLAWARHDTAYQLMLTLMHELGHALAGHAPRRALDVGAARRELAEGLPVLGQHPESPPEKAAESFGEAATRRWWPVFEDGLGGWQTDALGLFFEGIGCVLINKPAKRKRAKR